jgi:hypothetical protein
MQAYRIEPIQYRPFVVVADENQDLSQIAHQPLCFSPVNFTIEEISPNEIMDDTKIILLQDAAHAKQISKGHALEILVPGSQSDADYLENCVEVLVEAMQDAGMAPPAFIQLNNQLEALKMLDSLADSLKPDDFESLKRMVDTGKIQSMKLGGVEFRWILEPVEGRVTSLGRWLAA